METRRDIRGVIGLVLVLAADVLPIGKWGKAYLDLGPRWSGEAPYWAAALLTLIYVLVVERRSLASIGLKTPKVMDIVWGVGAGVLSVVGISLILIFVLPMLGLHMNTGRMNEIMALPFGFRLLLVTRAAVCEEILYRGYPIERLGELTGSRWIGGLVSLAAFVYAHLSGWGAAQLIAVAWAGAVLTGLYLWRRNLWANMVAHWIADGAGFLLAHG